MILITGASGLLGANLMLSARQRGLKTLALSHACPVRNPGGETVQADLSDEGNISRLLEHYRPRFFIHAAAATNVDWCELHPENAHRLNVDMSRYLAGAAASVGAQFAYISTDSVYSGDTGNYDEASEPAPVNIYAKTKLEGERAVQAVLPDALIVRTNIYGWNAQEKKSLAEWIIGELECGRTVRGFRDVFFNPLLATDLAEALFDALDLGISGICHVAGDESISKYEFARQVAVTFGRDPGLVTEHTLADAVLTAPRPRNTTLLTHKIAAIMGRPMPNVAKGLQRFKQQRTNGIHAELKKLVGM